MPTVDNAVAKAFRSLPLLLGSCDILWKLANQSLVLCHWTAANHLAVLYQSGFHNNVGFIPSLGNAGMAMFPVRASAARLVVMFPDFARRFHEFHGAALVSILSAGLCTAGFALALGSGFLIAVTGWRSRTVSAVLLMFLLLQFPKQRINLFG